MEKLGQKQLARLDCKPSRRKSRGQYALVVLQFAFAV